MSQEHPSPTAAVTHELKCHPEPFQATKRGDKLFEFRKDDRDFRVGDTLRLREWIPDGGWINGYKVWGHYTGRECARTITYIIREGFGIPEGYCIMGLSPSPAIEGEQANGLGVPASEQAVGPMLQSFAEDGERISANVPHAAPPDGWISVADRLPEPLKDVIVATDHNYVGQGYLIEASEWNGWEVRSIGCANVTHWRELPPAPVTPNTNEG